jgi:poly(A) polymerase
VSELEGVLSASPAVRAARGALGRGRGAWIVGGALRDALLGRAPIDLDLSVPPGEEEAAARTVARSARGHAFAFSEEFGTWRAVPPDREWQVDVTPIHGESITVDLEGRDFTINAMAMPLEGGELVDPHGGAPDLRSRTLRAVSERSFAHDPLRILRAARIGAALELDLDPASVDLARESAPRAAEPAGERQLAELRGIVAGPAPLRGLRLMDELDATPFALPELEALRGVEQNPYHHLDVHGHTMEVLDRLLEVERILPELLGETAGEVEALLAAPLADDLDRRGALRLAALFHDLGKPETRSVAPDGRILFIGHDRAGARIVGEICARLRASRRLIAYLQSVTLNHLRLGFLVHDRPLSRRQVYEYLRATEPESVDTTLLTIADRLATQGPKTRRTAIDDHLELAREMVAEALAWRRQGPPTPPIRGDELAAELGIEPGPELGRLLRELEAARFAGEVGSRADAVELARRLHSGSG